MFFTQPWRRSFAPPCICHLRNNPGKYSHALIGKSSGCFIHCLLEVPPISTRAQKTRKAELTCYVSANCIRARKIRVCFGSWYFLVGCRQRENPFYGTNRLACILDTVISRENLCCNNLHMEYHVMSLMTHDMDRN